MIFSDGFESGTLSAWDWTETDSGDLSVSSQAAFHGTYGLKAVIDDTNNLTAGHWLSASETHYSARFYLHPNSLSVPDSNGMYVFAVIGEPNYVAGLFLSKSGSTYTLMPATYNDDVTWIGGNTVVLNNFWNFIEVEWKAATAAGANNGYYKLWVNGVLADTISNIDSDTLVVASEYLGVLTDIPAGTSGTLYFDAFESRRGSTIGPLTLRPSGGAKLAVLAKPAGRMAGLPKSRSAALPNYSYGAMTWTKYYFAGTSRIASRACSGTTCSAPTYTLTDHVSINSTTARLDQPERGCQRQQDCRDALHRLGRSALQLGQRAHRLYLYRPIQQRP